MEDLSKIIREFEKSPYNIYENNRTKHEPTNSYFYLARYLVECMLRAYSLHSQVYSVRIEMNVTKHIMISHVSSTDESKSKEFLVEKTLLQVCSMDKDESKGIIVDESSTEQSE